MTERRAKPVFITQLRDEGDRAPRAPDLPRALLSEIEGVGDHVSQSTRLQKKLKEIKEVDAELAAKKDEYTQRLAAVKQKEELFRAKQHKAMAALRHFKIIVAEFDTKRQRGEKSAAELTKQIDAKKKEIQQLRTKLATVTRRRADLSKKLKRFWLYQEYLSSVNRARNEPDAPLDDLLRRYKVLDEAHASLSRENDEKSQALSNISNDMQNFTKTMENERLVYNFELARLSRELEELAQNASLDENDVASAEDRKKDAHRRFCELHMSVRNVFTRVETAAPTKRRKKKEGVKYTILENLMWYLSEVDEAIDDLTFIVGGVREGESVKQAISRGRAKFVMRMLDQDRLNNVLDSKMDISERQLAAEVKDVAAAVGGGAGRRRAGGPTTTSGLVGASSGLSGGGSGSRLPGGTSGGPARSGLRPPVRLTVDASGASGRTMAYADAQSTPRSSNSTRSGSTPRAAPSPMGRTPPAAASGGASVFASAAPRPVSGQMLAASGGSVADMGAASHTRARSGY